MKFLAIDVGNTRLKWALYENPHRQAPLLAHGAEFLDNIDQLAEGVWATLAPPQRMLGCVVAGDAVRRRVEAQMEIWDAAPQWVVSSAAEAGITNGYDFPTRLGADRWVAMIGAWHCALEQGPARPMVVVMVGTAVTVDAIDASGKFLGGLGNAIQPAREGFDVLAFQSGDEGLHQFGADLLRNLLFFAAGQHQIVKILRVARGLHHFDDEADAFVGFLRGGFQQFLKTVAFAEKFLQ